MRVREVRKRIKGREGPGPLCTVHDYLQVIRGGWRAPSKEEFAAWFPYQQISVFARRRYTQVMLETGETLVPLEMDAYGGVRATENPAGPAVDAPAGELGVGGDVDPGREPAAGAPGA